MPLKMWGPKCSHIDGSTNLCRENPEMPSIIIIDIDTRNLSIYVRRFSVPVLIKTKKSTFQDYKILWVMVYVHEFRFMLSNLHFMTSSGASYGLKSMLFNLRSMIITKKRLNNITLLVQLVPTLYKFSYLCLKVLCLSDGTDERNHFSGAHILWVTMHEYEYRPFCSTYSPWLVYGTQWWTYMVSKKCDCSFWKFF